MGGEFTILVSDRNRHVLDFLRRELKREGYRVVVANEGLTVLKMVAGVEPVELLILDPELSFVGGLDLLERIQGRKPLLPVIIHTFHAEDGEHPALQSVAAIIEKTGDNIDRIKTVVADVLRKCYPDRCASAGFDNVGDGTAKTLPEAHGAASFR